MPNPLFMRFIGCLAVAFGSVAASASASSIIWDNGSDDMFGVVASQTEFRFDVQVADDFVFPLGPGGETTWSITDVHWDGGYANSPQDGNFDFRVLIYADDGSGNSPTGGPGDPTFSALYVADFANAEVNETFTGIDGFGSLHFSYSVDLPTAFTADAGTKYWLAIQGVGVFPPQWGWATSTQQQHHEAVFGFPLLFTEYWTSTNEIDQIVNQDMSFRLTGIVPEPASGLLALLAGCLLTNRRRRN